MQFATAANLHVDAWLYIWPSPAAVNGAVVEASRSAPANSAAAALAPAGPEEAEASAVPITEATAATVAQTSSSGSDVAVAAADLFPAQTSMIETSVMPAMAKPSVSLAEQTGVEAAATPQQQLAATPSTACACAAATVIEQVWS